MISECKKCRTRFWPWKLWCPNCGRALPIVGATILLALLFAFCAIAALFSWWFGFAPDQQ
jgi:hypothetical protein